MATPINLVAVIRRVQRAARQRLPDPIGSWKILRGDRVQIIAGADKGKQGEIVNVLRDKHKVIIAGANLRKRFVSRTEHSKGRIIEVESPIHISNVALLDPVSGKPTRVNWVKQESGLYERVAAASQTIIPEPSILKVRRKPKPTPTSKCTSPEDTLEITYRPEAFQ